MELIIKGEPKEIAALDRMEQERQKWRRFELVTHDCAQINELNGVLARHQLTRRELAVILATLHVRSGFSLEDFDT